MNNNCAISKGSLPGSNNDITAVRNTEMLAPVG
ncbi:hypothetical protein T11_3049 [Trichinella zimbabwensis]|uniref:Uncharacterized protein n=1 Tax=Trichinella zimbabwensis TaxID=268475 RepID=A0A0V1GIE7_9BILA|nr:hypothetical protein T11_18188 [Trichinella zimbabwensis]KRY97996.1 hypothetical protein T11_3049 [Trichinella zimbabwensis]